jgi:phosphoribosyl-ATP pyrophosphohydrolase/phosphoribosyl-AMP cyclohydrolase
MSDAEAMARQIHWDERGLVPVVVQDVHTHRVLMLAYMNGDALARTQQSGETWFWSRSRGELWHKGATSGNRQQVVDMHYDCDGDALLVRVRPLGPACHTGHASCFHNRLVGASAEGGPAEGVLGHLWSVIQDRKMHPKQGSYTCHLLSEGETEILKKVGEEAIEVILAAQSEGNERLVSELADLAYHALVLLAARDLSWVDVEAALARRFG